MSPVTSACLCPLKLSLAPPRCPHPHLGASPPASPVTCAQDGGGRSCPILGWLGPCASVSPSVTGLPWDGGTSRTLGEEEPLWPPRGDKDVATSPKEHGMKLEAPGIEARVSHLPPHPCHRHSYPKSPFIPEFVTPLSPSPGRGGRSGCGHPTSLCGRRGGGWGSSSARVPPAQLRLVTICRSLFFFSINLVGSKVVASGTLPRGTFQSRREGTTHLRLRTSVSSMSRSWAARSSSRRCW